MKIVRRLYGKHYYFVALNEKGRRVAWRKIAGNKNAKKEVLEKGKIKIKFKPVIFFTGVNKTGFETYVEPPLKKDTIAVISADFKVYDNKGKLINKIYHAKDRYTINASKKEQLEDLRYMALGQALAEAGLIETSDKARTVTGKGRDYNAVLILSSVKYQFWIPNKNRNRYL